MVNSERTDVYLRIALGNEGARVRTISETLRDIESLLADIERQVRGTTKAEAEWAWLETPVLEFTASANGVSAPELRQVVTEFRHGFDRAREAREQQKRVEWPDSFDPQARKQANKILKRLEDLGSLAISAEDLPEVFIDAAEVTELVIGTPRLRRVRSTVEGELEVISKRGGLRASLKELNSNNNVSIIFSDDSNRRPYRRRVHLGDARWLICPFRFSIGTRACSLVLVTRSPAYGGITATTWQSVNVQSLPSAPNSSKPTGTAEVTT